MGVPKLYNLEPLYNMGINPKNGLPFKLTSGDPETLKQDVEHFLAKIDEQDAVNRYVWYNLPCNLTSQELERILYYRGQLCFFFDAASGEFYFMPYALNGSCDFYGRYKNIHPVPLYWSDNYEENSAALKAQYDYLSTLNLKCVYGVKMPEELDLNALTESAVLLWDYSKGWIGGEKILPRVNINKPIVSTMADCVPMMRTSLLLGSGVNGMRVNDADQAQNVYNAANAMENAAMTGKPWMPIVGNIDFQELTNGQVAKSEEFMLAMQSLDNLRLSGYGIDNGGLFEKKAHELQSEADINGGPVGLVLQDGLSIRQNFCNIVNSIWGLGIWCEPAQNIMGADIDGDGLTYDRNDEGQNSGTDTESNEGGQE